MFVYNPGCWPIRKQGGGPMDFLLFEKTVFLFTFRHYFPRYSRFYCKRLSLSEERTTCFSIFQKSYGHFGKAKTILTNVTFFFLLFALIIGLDVLLCLNQNPIFDWCVRILQAGLLLWKFDVFFLPKAYLFLFLAFALLSLAFAFSFSLTMLFMAILINVLASQKEGLE